MQLKSIVSSVYVRYFSMIYLYIDVAIHTNIHYIPIYIYIYNIYISLKNHYKTRIPNLPITSNATNVECLSLHVDDVTTTPFVAGYENSDSSNNVPDAISLLPNKT